MGVRNNEPNTAKSQTGKMEPGEYDKVYESVILLLCSGKYCSLSNKTQQFYIAWSKLTKEQQSFFDSNMVTYMPSELQPLYQALMDAFSTWDKTQNQHGAPGWNSANVTLFEESELTMRLSSLVNNCEVVWKRFRKEVLEAKRPKSPNAATNDKESPSPSTS